MDQIEKVNPAGVIALGYIFEISAWLYQPRGYPKYGTLSQVVHPIVIRETINRRYLI